MFGPPRRPLLGKKHHRERWGLFAWLPLLPRGPTSSRTGDFLAPASNKRLAMITPSTSAVVMAAVPLMGRSVAKPSPITTVLGLVTRIASVRSYVPGVNRRFFPLASCLLMVAAVSKFGLAI